MKPLLFLVLVCLMHRLQAQDSAVVDTDKFTIEGKVKKPYSFTFADARRFVSIAIDSVTITNHRFEPRGVLHEVKGVLLKDVVEKAQIDAPDAKVLSEYYIECIATDNYKVVFSWNELFNTGIGYNVLIITESDGQKGMDMKDRICLLSSTDHTTGRRYVKGLEKVVVKRVE